MALHRATFIATFLFCFKNARFFARRCDLPLEKSTRFFQYDFENLANLDSDCSVGGQIFLIGRAYFFRVDYVMPFAKLFSANDIHVAPWSFKRLRIWYSPFYGGAVFYRKCLYHLQKITSRLSTSKLPDFVDRNLPHIINIRRVAIGKLRRFHIAQMRSYFPQNSISLKFKSLELCSIGLDNSGSKQDNMPLQLLPEPEVPRWQPHPQHVGYS